MLLSAGWSRWLALIALAVLLLVARGVLPPFGTGYHAALG